MLNNNLSFRLAVEQDYEIIADIYRQSVLKIAPNLYNQKQVIAWSNFANNREKFHHFIFKPQTYLLEKEKQIIAFCGLENNGHIASFYVHPNFNRQGYGKKILTYVLGKGEDLGIKRFFTEASFFSQPVFSLQGFDIIAIETVRYGDVVFDRFQMEKILV